MKESFFFNVFVLTSVNKYNNNQFGSGFTWKYCPENIALGLQRPRLLAPLTDIVSL